MFPTPLSIGGYQINSVRVIRLQLQTCELYLDMECSCQMVTPRPVGSDIKVNGHSRSTLIAWVISVCPGHLKGLRGRRGHHETILSGRRHLQCPHVGADGHFGDPSVGSLIIIIKINGH